MGKYNTINNAVPDLMHTTLRFQQSQKQILIEKKQIQNSFKDFSRQCSLSQMRK